MRRLILFSNFVTLPDREGFLDVLFPQELSVRTFAYIPPDGMNSPQYAEIWKEYCAQRHIEFVYVDIESSGQQQAILDADVLLFTGGNTFQLLDNLRKNDLFDTIKSFTQKDHWVIAGFSAGALLLTPSIALAADEDENAVGLTHLEGLHLVDFDVYPHYTDDTQALIDAYAQEVQRKVVPLRDDEYLVIDL